MKSARAQKFSFGMRANMSLRGFLGPLVIVTLGLSACPVPASAQTGLVAAYGFNEGAGTIAADASGNNLTGTVSGAAWSSAGKFGGALTFDGATSWVTVNNSTLLQLTTGMTVEAWVQTSTPTDWSLTPDCSELSMVPCRPTSKRIVSSRRTSMP